MGESITEAPIHAMAALEGQQESRLEDRAFNSHNNSFLWNVPGACSVPAPRRVARALAPRERTPHSACRLATVANPANAAALQIISLPWSTIIYR
ncbi:MAG: hypothetical protein P4K83_06175 [Terracidiphilus sp.]|nr:hypothetical protein [Terracidiphilus sp.]